MGGVSSGLTRGPLPPSVYWRRRAVVLTLAAVLVFGIGQLLSLGSDGSGGPTQGAQLAGADASGGARPTPSAGTSTGSTAPAAVRGSGREGGKNAQAALAAPVGTCADDDVQVTPVVKHAVGGRDVTLTLELETLQSPACTWTVGPRHLTLRITSGSDRIWSTLDCPRALPNQDVVVRQAVPTTVQVTWAGARRSDVGCTRQAGWALPGYYHLQAAALGGEPGDVQFKLHRPEAPVITRTAEPTQQPSPSPGSKAKAGR